MFGRLVLVSLYVGDVKDLAISHEIVMENVFPLAHLCLTKQTPGPWEIGSFIQARHRETSSRRVVEPQLGWGKRRLEWL